MAWRYKASKYKNAAPKIPKKEEWIMGIPANDVGISCGNHIKASCVYAAFNTDLGGGGGSLGYLPLSTKGRQTPSSVPIIHAHSDLVTDLDFSPFDDYLLATGSLDSQVKVWLLPEEAANVSEPVVAFSNHSRRIGNVLWHPTADGILAVTGDNTLSVFDIGRSEGQSIFNYPGHGDVIQSVSWKGDGSLMVTSCKDKKLRVFDPRANKVVQECQCFGNAKDSRVLWLGGKDFLLSTGFTVSRSRECCVWDPRNLQSSLNRTELGSSNGTVMPLFDVDTNMTFLVGKGDCTVNYLELTEKSPYLTPASVDHTEQVKGVCLVPKRAMNLMSAEVNRLLLLCQDSIIPVPYIIPRKTYHDFHEDIFPETRDGIPAMNGTQWFQGQDTKPPTITPVPAKTLIHSDRRGGLFREDTVTPSSQPAVPASPPARNVQDSSTAETPKTQNIMTSSPASNQQASNQPTSPSIQENTPMATPKIVKPFHKTRQSKYRYIQGKLEHSSCSITNIRNICKSMPGEGSMLAVNETRCAIPLEGAGGCIQILEFSNPGRLQDTDIPQIQNGSKVTDFAWDPFDDSRLVVGLDSAKLNVWKVPDGGLTESSDEPLFSLWGHQEKIYFVKFHPLASGILASGSYDTTVRVWDLDKRKEIVALEGHGDQVLCVGWSQDGRHCATVCKDGKVRVFDPRKSGTVIKEGDSPVGQRGARIVWVLNDKFIVVSGFNSSSSQEVRMYETAGMNCVGTVTMERSPMIMVPHYDADCSLLYLTSRGERTVVMIDVIDEEPFLLECSPFKMESLHQAADYLPKRVCDVRKVQVAKGWRLTSNCVEAMTFTVPRVKPQYFQDDLYPDTAVLKPSMTAAQWLAGENIPTTTVSLRPADMQPLSQAPVEAPKPKKFESFNEVTFKSDEQKKEELLNAIVGKLEISNDPMPQDLTEGVDDDEWDD